MDWKIELIFVPVSDVDRAKEFYERIGFHLDHDHRVSDDLRFVQMTLRDRHARSRSGSGWAVTSHRDSRTRSRSSYRMPMRRSPTCARWMSRRTASTSWTGAAS